MLNALYLKASLCTLDYYVLHCVKKVEDEIEWIYSQLATAMFKLKYLGNVHKYCNFKMRINLYMLCY